MNTQDLINQITDVLEDASSGSDIDSVSVNDLLKKIDLRLRIIKAEAQGLACVHTTEEFED